MGSARLTPPLAALFDGRRTLPRPAPAKSQTRMTVARASKFQAQDHHGAEGEANNIGCYSHVTAKTATEYV